MGSTKSSHLRGTFLMVLWGDRSVPPCHVGPCAHGSTYAWVHVYGYELRNCVGVNYTFGLLLVFCSQLLCSQMCSAASASFSPVPESPASICTGHRWFQEQILSHFSLHITLASLQLFPSSDRGFQLATCRQSEVAVSGA